MIAMTISAQTVLWALVLLVSAALAFAYSALETGIYVMNKIRLDLQAEIGHGPARIVRDLIRSQGNFLAVLLIGSSLANYGATFAVSALFVLAGYGDSAEWCAMAVAAPSLFVLCESVPKNLAQRSSQAIVYSLSPVLRASNFLFHITGLAPLVRTLATWLMRLAGPQKRGFFPMGHEGLATVVAEGQASGILTHLQTVMADRVMHIATVKLADVMIPMSRAAYAPADIDRTQMLNLMRAHNHSRFPLVDEHGKVVTILNIYEALSGGEQAAPSARSEPLVLAHDAGVTDALYRMQHAHAPMAIVADNVGKHVGIVTVKDIVEEIVGELEAG